MNEIFDLDTIAGFYPRKKADISLKKLNKVLKSHIVRRSCLVSARGVFYDSRDGNEETLVWAEASRVDCFSQFTPVGTVDMRNFEGEDVYIQSLRVRGVRIWRLFPDEQGWDCTHPGFISFLDCLDGSGDILYMPGKLSSIKSAASGRDLRIIVDTHFYNLTDTLFSIEPGDGFFLSTRRLHGPGVIKKICEKFGSERMLFASGSPLMSLSGALAIVRNADLSVEEEANILGGNLSQMLGGRAL